MNGDGSIKFDEFKKLYYQLYKTEVNVKETFDYIDKSKDGNIDFNDFIIWLNWF